MMLSVAQLLLISIRKIEKAAEKIHSFLLKKIWFEIVNWIDGFPGASLLRHFCLRSVFDISGHGIHYFKG